MEILYSISYQIEKGTGGERNRMGKRETERGIEWKRERFGLVRVVELGLI